MKTKTKFLMSLLLVLALTITSCSKEGDIGPAGPAGTIGVAGPAGQDGENGESLGAPGPKGDTGDTGADGEDGEDGADGADGEDGADGADGEDGMDGEDGLDGTDGASVIVSDWIEPTEDAYTLNNPRIKSLELADRLNLPVVRETVLLVYYDNDVEVTLLPRHSFTTTGTPNKSIEASVNFAGRTLDVSIRKYNSDITAREFLWVPSAPPYSKGVRFRYFFIPHTINIGAKSKPIDFKKMSYAQVVRHFNVQP